MRHTTRHKTKLLSVKVPTHVSAKVVRLAHERKTTVSSVVRDALEVYDSEMKSSFGALARDHIGSVKGGPGDLATNPKHLKGLGSWRK